MLLTSKGINANRNTNASRIYIPTNNRLLTARALYRYSPQYESSRPNYTKDHETFLRNNKPLEMCLGNGPLPSQPSPCVTALTGVGSHTMKRGRKG